MRGRGARGQQGQKEGEGEEEAETMRKGV